MGLRQPFITGAVLVAMQISSAFACSPPPPGSSYELDILKAKEDGRKNANIIVEGVWHYSAAALRADQRMDARLKALPLGTMAHTKIKDYWFSYAAVMPTKVTRGKPESAYKVWYSRKNQTCPSDGPPEGTRGTFYLKRNLLRKDGRLWLAVFDKAVP